MPLDSRVRDWRTSLLTWAVVQRGRPYQWGETDCAVLARKAWAILFGHDVVPELPHWRTARQATVVLKRHGPLVRILERLGAERVAVAFARAGDLVLLDEPEEPVGRQAVLICVDGRTFLGSASSGVHFVERDELPRTAVAYSLWSLASG